MKYNGITVLDTKSTLQRKKKRPEPMYLPNHCIKKKKLNKRKKKGVTDNIEHSKAKCLRNVEQTGL